MDFAGEAEQHKVIHDRLDDLSAMLLEARADVSKFDAENMKATMTALKEPLVRLHVLILVIQSFDIESFQFTHLDEEVEHITAPKMKEAGFSEQEILTMMAYFDKYAQSHADPFLVVPFMCR
jgi:hypothetical protein